MPCNVADEYVQSPAGLKNIKSPLSIKHLGIQKNTQSNFENYKVLQVVACVLPFHYEDVENIEDLCQYFKIVVSVKFL